MSEPIFDPSVYSTIPTLTLSALTVLARTLVTVAPRGLTALGQRALGRLETLARAGQAAQAARQRQLGTSSDESREIDVLADRSLAAIRRRLEGCALHTVEQDPDAPRAAELDALLFPAGLELSNLPYVEQLAAMEILVTRIEEEGLAGELDAICGPRYLAALKEVLPRYRDMVQKNLKQQDSSENLQEHRRKLGAAIADYATKVAALYDAEDEKSAERIRAALRPIDVLRAQLARRPATDAGEPEQEPTANLPTANPPTANPPTAG